MPQWDRKAFAYILRKDLECNIFTQSIFVKP